MDEKDAEISHLRALNDKMLADLVDMENKHREMWCEWMASRMLVTHVAQTGKVPIDHRLLTVAKIFRLHFLQSALNKTDAFLGVIYSKDLTRRTDPVVREVYLTLESFIGAVHGATDDLIATFERDATNRTSSTVWFLGGKLLSAEDTGDKLKLHEAFREMGYEMSEIWDPYVGKTRMYFNPITKDTVNGSDPT